MEEDLKVTFYGYDKFKKLLKEADPELRKQMDQEIKSFLTPVSSLAKSKVPGHVLSGWEPDVEVGGKWAAKAWDKNKVEKGITVRQGGTRRRGSATRSAWRIANLSAAGSIYELAGRKSDGKTPAGKTFVEMLKQRGGEPSRLIWRAWDEKGGEKAITRGVVEIVNKFETELKSRLD